MIGYAFRVLTGKSPIREKLKKHFHRVPLESILTTARDFPLASRVDVQIALDEILSAYRVTVLGIHSALGHDTPTLAHLFTRGPFPIEIGPLQHDDIDVGEDIYGNGEFLQWLAERDITPYMRTRDSVHRKNSPFYGPERFTYLPESNSYRCPAGQPLNYGGRNQRNRTYAYIGTRKRCGACLQKAQCTSGAFRYLAIHMDEPARQRARELVSTPEFAKAQRERKKVEALFAELKNQIGLRRLRLRRLKFVREQFFLAAAAQNIKRLVRFLCQGQRPTLAATT